MQYKYWIVENDYKECFFSQDEFKTQDELLEYLEENDLAYEPDNIYETDNEYEIKSTCLSYGRSQEYNYKCPYCGREYSIDEEYYPYDYADIENNFEYFGRDTLHCVSRECNKIFNLKNEYGAD